MLEWLRTWHDEQSPVRAAPVVLLASLAWAGGSACDGAVSSTRVAAVDGERAAVTSSLPDTTTREGSGSAAVAGVSEFSVFWKQFRVAALAGDTASLLAMTDIPFRLLGPTDADPTVDRDSAAFLALLPRLLDADPGLSVQPTTMRALLADAVIPPPGAVDGDEARVGGFVFARRAGRWHFALAYLSDTLRT